MNVTCLYGWVWIKIPGYNHKGSWILDSLSENLSVHSSPTCQAHRNFHKFTTNATSVPPGFRCVCTPLLVRPRTAQTFIFSFFCLFHRFTFSVPSNCTCVHLLKLRAAVWEASRTTNLIETHTYRLGFIPGWYSQTLGASWTRLCCDQKW